MEVSSSLQNVRLKIQAVIASQCRPFLSVIPMVQENVQGSAQFNIGLTSFDAVEADCVIQFVGEANPTTRASATLGVHIDTTAPNQTLPPEVLPSCTPAGECLTQEEATNLAGTCAAVSGYACDAAKSCFVCGEGLDNIQSISLTVSNLRNDRKVFPLRLKFEPRFDESYDIVWDQQFNTLLPMENQIQLVPAPAPVPQQTQQQIYSPYSLPYNGVSMPFNTYATAQYGTQPFYSLAYPFGYTSTGPQVPGVPELQQPFIASGGIIPTAQRTGFPPEPYGAQTVYQNYQMPAGFNLNSQTYPGLVAGQAVLPPYCQQFMFNFQAGYGNRFGNTWNNPYSMGVPFGMPNNCQYPMMCQSPQMCGYAAFGGSNWNVQLGFNYRSECSYPSICNNPGRCPDLANQQSTQTTTPTTTTTITYKQV
ncbi:MAG TPA: hypothetical protein VJI67_03090, partial [archaeon]|nr:hypothetical protein [archaeon]